VRSDTYGAPFLYIGLEGATMDCGAWVFVIMFIVAVTYILRCPENE